MNDETYEKGLAIRREVLGAEYADKSLANADDFNRDFYRNVIESCWGMVWGREGLDRKTRSFLNLAMLCALNRPHELKLHIAGALKNGVTRDEMKEVFLQVGAYCGAPAALDGFRIAREVFAEQEKAAAK
ncbi:MAG TPA: carboxymuconolactone decarboxylase family protein [Usitatibacteraceae bacterium]|nr:carboxymuconolactone decarboxylase family protein [Usitatibacteraceae bacterium]